MRQEDVEHTGQQEYEASGGEASHAKIAAARELHLPVVMIQRPKAEDAAGAA